MNSFKKIIILGTLTELIWITFLLINPLRKFLGDQALVLSINNGYFAVTLLLFLAGCFYFLTHNLIANQRNFKIAMIFFIIFNFTLLFAWPLTSIDAFVYIHSARVLSIHHANPYIFAFDDFPQDAFAPLIKNCWSAWPTPYAPLFTLLSSGLTWLGKNSLIITLFLFKFLFISLNIFSCLLLHKTFQKPKITFLYAWNPLLLFEFGVNSHNDILTIFFLLLGLYFILKKNLNLKNYSLAWFFLLLSVLIKFITAMLLPIFGLLILKKIETKKDKLIFLGLTILISGATLFAFYAPFWQGLETFSRILFHANHVYAAWIFSSWLVIVLALLFFGFGLPNFVKLATLTGKISFLLFYLYLIIKIIFTKINNFKKTLLQSLLLTLAVFYLTFFTWLMPWYFSVLIVLLLMNLALTQDKKYFWATHFLTFFGILYYLILR